MLALPIAVGSYLVWIGTVVQAKEGGGGLIIFAHCMGSFGALIALLVAGVGLPMKRTKLYWSTWGFVAMCLILALVVSVEPSR